MYLCILWLLFLVVFACLGISVYTSKAVAIFYKMNGRCTLNSLHEQYLMSFLMRLSNTG